MRNHRETGASPWTILDLLKWTTSYFKSHDIDQARADAEVLLAHTLQLRRIDLYLRYDQPLHGDELSAFKTLIKRRIRREPVAYITGVKEFWSIELEVTRDVLIPRPETECLVEAALAFLMPEDLDPSRQTVLDLGTGSGAIVLALASERSNPLYFASDVSAGAVRLARKNAWTCGLEQAVHFVVGDFFEPFKTGCPLFDMIISNPPYIREREIPGLLPEISRFEPVGALSGGKDGLDAIRRIIDQAAGYLKPRGRLLLEIGCDQKNDVRRIIESGRNYSEVVFFKDYSDRDRGVHMVKQG